MATNDWDATEHGFNLPSITFDTSNTISTGATYVVDSNGNWTLIQGTSEDPHAMDQNWARQLFHYFREPKSDRRIVLRRSSGDIIKS